MLWKDRNEQAECGSEPLNSFHGHRGFVNENVLFKERMDGEKDSADPYFWNKDDPSKKLSAY